MGLFGSIFNKEKTHKGYFELAILQVIRLNESSVKIEFDIPKALQSKFNFTAGQFINVLIQINGKEERRSYSICSANEEALAIGVKRVQGGAVSNWLNNEAREGTKIFVSEAQGNFKVPDGSKDIATIAAGSGITPILSILKSKKDVPSMHLLYGNRSKQETMFLEDINKMDHIEKTFFLDSNQGENAIGGRIDKENLIKFIKSDLSFLKKDAFLICGPEQMILGCIEALEFFGISKDKIIYELFTTPVTLGIEEDKTSFSGTSEVTVTLDDEEFLMTMESDTKTILDAVEEEGMDAPYSCRGGVCCSCKAKVIEGDADMRLNYSLTDQEVEEGYILTCQAYPTEPKLKISFDE